MAGLRVIVSLGGFLFILLTSFSAASKARTAKRTWKDMTLVDLDTHKYFAVVKYGGATPAYCSACIISPSAVMTFCKGDPKIAYAGMVKLEGLTKKTTKTVQERTVQSVVENRDMRGMKICTLDKKWDWTAKVGPVTLHLDQSEPEAQSCDVLGFVKTTGAHRLEKQTIGARDKCKIKLDDPQVPDNKELLYSEAATTQVLAAGDQGGPAVCGTEPKLWGINVKTVYGEAAARDTVSCNTYVNISHHSTWIEQNTPEDSEENQGPNGTGNGTGSATGNGTGNGTGASAGFSIHGYMKKNSVWKVLGLLLLSLVISLLL